MKKHLFLIFLTAILTSCSLNNKKADFYGNFESVEITVSSEALGKIIKFDIDEGELLKAGDRACIIDTVDLYLKMQQILAQKNASEASLTNIQSQINVQKQIKENLLVEKARTENLLKDNAATIKQLDDINGNIKLVEKQIASIESQNLALNNNIRALQLQAQQLSESVRKCYTKNPVDGTVLTVYTRQGELATIGKPLYKIADLSKMYLRAYVSETQLPLVRIGGSVDIFIDTGKSEMKKFTGTVSWISQSAEFTPKIIQTKQERVNLVYAVKILVLNDGTLKIGMPGEGNFK